MPYYRLMDILIVVQCSHFKDRTSKAAYPFVHAVSIFCGPSHPVPAL